ALDAAGNCSAASSSTDNSVSFGNFASIAGTKFNDVDGDGTQAPGELGAAGVTINLDLNADGTVDATTTTDSNGNYHFDNLAPGTYRVREVAPAGTVQTTTNPADIVLSSNQTVTGIDFGNFTRITIG